MRFMKNVNTSAKTHLHPQAFGSLGINIKNELIKLSKGKKCMCMTERRQMIMILCSVALRWDCINQVTEIEWLAPL